MQKNYLYTNRNLRAEKDRSEKHGKYNILIYLYIILLINRTFLFRDQSNGHAIIISLMFIQIYMQIYDESALSDVEICHECVTSHCINLNGF